MIPLNVLVSIFLAMLLLILILGLPHLKTPRKVGIQGIDDPETAKAYDRLSRTPQFGLIRRSFVKKLKKYNAEGTIVDIGCGPGYLLKTIAQQWPRNKLMGVDLSEEMIDRAKVNLDSLGFCPRAEFRVGSAENLPFDDETQDFVVSTGSLHHWTNPDLAFNEIHRVLKPGGQLLILDMRRDTRRIVYWFIRFVQTVALRFIGLDALRRINEPTGSLLASYTGQEIREIISKTAFYDFKIEDGLAWLYLWAGKVSTLETGKGSVAEKDRLFRTKS